MIDLENFIQRKENFDHRRKADRFIRQINGRKGGYKRNNETSVAMMIDGFDDDYTDVRVGESGPINQCEEVIGEVAKIAQSYETIMMEYEDYEEELNGRRQLTAYQVFRFMTGSFRNL